MRALPVTKTNCAVIIIKHERERVCVYNSGRWEYYTRAALHKFLEGVYICIYIEL